MQVLLVPSVEGKEHMSKLLVSQAQSAYCDMQAAMIKREGEVQLDNRLKNSEYLAVQFSPSFC